MQKKLGIIIAALVIAGGIAILFFGKLEKNLVYFVTPKELLAKGEMAYDRPVRLGGMVKPGSISWNPSGPELHFLLTDGSETIPVISKATPPQMFQDGMGVVVEGKLTRLHFAADRLMVKHSNEYHPPKEGEKPTVIYKELVDPNNVAH